MESVERRRDRAKGRMPNLVTSTQNEGSDIRRLPAAPPGRAVNVGGIAAVQGCHWSHEPQ